MKNISKEKLSEHIRKHYGNKTAIAESLGIKSHHTLNGYIERWGLKELVQEQNERVLDTAVFNINKEIIAGGTDLAVKLSQWILERRRYSEYGNRQTVETINKEPLKVIVESQEIADKIDKIK